VTPPTALPNEPLEPPSAQGAAPPPQAPPLSTMVEPGVHVTPLGLPPGRLSVPTDNPTEDNLEN
jgi:hypothetical protein